MESVNDLANRAAEQLDENIRVIKALHDDLDNLQKISRVIASAYGNGNKLILFGNGGSAADAEHIACEMAGKFYLHRPSLPAFALTTNTAILTSIANDFSYEEVFQRQLQGIVVKGDVVIGISTSGSSRNVLLALEEARNRQAITIAFTGASGPITNFADYLLSVPSTDTPRIQEAHITAGHVICFMVEQMLFG